MSQKGKSSGQSRDHRLFGNIVISKQLAKRSQVEECLMLQAQEAGVGILSRPLGEILVERGYITASQVEVVLEEQQRRSGPLRIGPYEILSKLGEGGMGSVYKARETDTGHEVALKIISRKVTSSKTSQVFFQRFQREAQVGMELDHPNIVRVLDSGEARGVPFIALELIKGGSLKDLLKKRNKILTEDECLNITRQVAAALQHAYERDLVHRDVKPDNIMFGDNGEAKLADFGLVKSIETEASDLTQTGIAVGTPDYIAPEQAKGKSDIDIRADIYSLGATLYRMATGEKPFKGSSPFAILAMHLNAKLIPPDDLNPGLSDPCVSVIERMMAKKPEDRYATPAELIEDLDLVLDGIEPEGAGLAEGKSSLQMSAKRLQRARARRGATSGSRNRRITTGHQVPVGVRKRTTGPREPVGARKRKPTGLREPIGGRRQRTTGPREPIEARDQDRYSGRVEPSRPVALYVGIGAVVLAIVLGFTVGGKKEIKIQDNDKAKDVTETETDVKKETAPSTVLIPKRIPKKKLPSPADQFRNVFSWEKKNPNAYSELIIRYANVKKAAVAVQDMRLSSRADGARRNVEARRAQAVEAAWIPLERRSRIAVLANDYDAALKMLANHGRVAKEILALLKPKADALAKKFRGEVTAKITGVMAKAVALSKKAQPGKGLEALTALTKLKYTPLATKISALKKRLTREKANVAALSRKRTALVAKKRWNEYLSKFDGFVAKGNYDDAAKVAAKAKADPILKAFAKETQALVSVAALVSRQMVAYGKIRASRLKNFIGKTLNLKTASGTRKGKLIKFDANALTIQTIFTINGSIKLGPKISIPIDSLALETRSRLFGEANPTTPDGWMARAISELSKGKVAQFSLVREALGKAEDHPLVQRYRDTLRGLEAAKAQVAAEAVWKNGFANLLAMKEFDERKAISTRDALKSFRTEYEGKTTKFFMTKAKEIAVLESKIANALGGPNLANLKKIFHGKVVHFDTKTLKIELFYDFENKEQQQDWILSTFAHQRKAGGNIVVDKGALRFTRTGRYAMLKGIFVSVESGVDFSISGKGWGDAFLLGNASEGGNYNWVAGLQAWKNSYLGRGVKGRFSDVTRKIVSPCVSTKRGSMVLKIANGVLHGQVGKMIHEGKDTSFTSGHVGLWAHDTDTAFDNLYVKGVLDRKWLEKELEQFRSTKDSSDVKWRDAIDLISVVDLAKDTVAGKWKRLAEGGVKSEIGNGSRIELPYVPPKEYDFLISFSRIAGESWVGQLASKDQSGFGIFMGHKKLLELGYINRRNRRSPISGLLMNGKIYTSILKVRERSMTTFLDGKLIHRWLPADGPLSPYPSWKLRNEKLLGLGSSSSTIFHRALVCEVTGRGTFTRGRPKISSRDVGSHVQLAVGLVGHWKFDDGKGTTALDLSGKGNHATLKGGTTWVKGRVGGALKFDGLDDFMSVPNVVSSGSKVLNSSRVTLLEDASISFWLNPSKDNGVILAQGWKFEGNESGWVVYLGSNRHSTMPRSISWGSGDKSGNHNKLALLPSAENSIKLGSWQHIIIVKSETTVSIYIDGILATQGKIKSSKIAYIKDNMQLVFGYAADPYYRNYYGGLLDDVRIYNRALSVAEVKALAAMGKPAKVSSKKSTKAPDAVARQTAYAVKHRLKKDLTLNLGEGVKMEFTLIPPGTFMMGDPKEEIGPGYKNHKPQHPVTVTQEFYLGRFEVTQSQYERVMGNNPSRFKGMNLPVEQVSWLNCVTFCKNLSEKIGRTVKLPTEAEWEYACRAGSDTRFFFGNDISKLKDFGWSKNNAEGKTHPVGRKKSNPWGLCDMYGNVWEWCQDWHGAYTNRATNDPQGAATGVGRILRGCATSIPEASIRSTYRGSASPSTWRRSDFGFRVLLRFPSRSKLKQKAGKRPKPLLAFTGPINGWTNTSKDGKWSNPANWILERVPRAGDNIVFNGKFSSDCNAAAGSVAQNLKTLTVRKTFKGSINFEPNFAEGGAQELTIRGDVNLLGGTLVVSGVVNGEGKVATGLGVTFNAANFTVGKEAVLHSDGAGFRKGGGPGGVVGKSSATHGGRGINYGNPPPLPYGSASHPISLGSSAQVAAGGGAIKINCVKGTIFVGGVVRVNGESSHSDFGGGSGGSIWLICDSFQGSGWLQADGGSGRLTGGGGGRISVSWNSSTYSGSYSCSGGQGKLESHPGTLSLPQGCDLIIEKDVGLAPGTHRFRNVLIKKGAALVFHGAWAGNGKDAQELLCKLEVSKLVVEPGGIICANSEGFGPGSGPGFGAGTARAASHGGKGGNGLPAYGNSELAESFGSGNAGYGGGAVHIDANHGNIILNGIIRTNGSSRGDNNGGAAGGSIFLRCGVFSGKGRLEAQGGSSNNIGGGGGRIAVHYQSKDYSGTISVKGGISNLKRINGQAGTVVVRKR